MNHLRQKAKGSALVTLLGAVVIVVSVLFLLIKLAMSGYHIDVADSTATATATETRIMPSGVVTEGDGIPAGQRSGEAIFNKICIQCHAADSVTPNAPRITNTGEWAARISKGFETLINHAINGFNAMPPRGGASDLTDDEIARAIAYMANQSGGNFTAPEPSAGEGAASEAGAAVGAGDAQAKFEKSCAACHGAASAVPGAPKITNTADWAPRIKQGKDVVFKHALEGLNAMPPRGGTSMSDDEIKAIVTYMVNQSGGQF